MKWRIWLVSLCITFVSVVLFGIYATQVYYNSSVDDGKNYLKVYMNAFDRADYSFDEAGAKEFSEKLNGARVTFMDAQGSVVGDSATDAPDVDHSTRPEIIEAITNGDGFAVRSSSTLGKNMIYYCRNFADNGQYLVRIAIFTDSGWLIFVKTLPTLVSFLAIMIGLCVIVAVVTTNIIVEPMKKLAVEAVDNDSVTTPYPELEPIAAVLNERSRNIKSQMTEIKSEKDLVEKAKLSKDEFISNVTHEMNTPLTSIHGYAELLDAGGLNDEQKALAYKTILAQSERLTNLIACIINYSEIDSDDLPSYEVNFSSLARETLSALKPEADKRNVSIVENIDDNVIILSRHEYLDELFGNLVRNAIKYNKDGGKVTVTLNRNSLVVEDTGIGIAEENKEKVFSRFFTVDKSHGGKNGGFGLGLAVVRKICRKSGWKLSLESTLGEGSKFTVTF